jgi:hypothetical protein
MFANEKMSEKDLLIMEIEEVDRIVITLKDRLRNLLIDLEKNPGNKEYLEDKYTVCRIKLIYEEQRYYRLLDDLRDYITRE